MKLSDSSIRYWFQFLSLVVFLSCSPSPQKVDRTVVDDLGHRIRIKREVKKIVSLVPTNSEMVCLLDCTRLVGGDTLRPVSRRVGLKDPRKTSCHRRRGLLRREPGKDRPTRTRPDPSKWAQSTKICFAVKKNGLSGGKFMAARLGWAQTGFFCSWEKF